MGSLWQPVGWAAQYIVQRDFRNSFLQSLILTTVREEYMDNKYILQSKDMVRMELRKLCAFSKEVGLPGIVSTSNIGYTNGPNIDLGASGLMSRAIVSEINSQYVRTETQIAWDVFT